MDPAQQTLIQARRLIAAGWCQGTQARTPTGASCNIFAPNAAQFCALGAISRAAGKDRAAALEALDRISALIPPPHYHPEYSGITRWNDARATTREQVLALFDLAAG